MSERDRRYYAAHRLAQLTKNREWRRKNPEWMKAWRARNREKASALARLRAFGITAEQFDDLLRQQGYCCAICRATEPGGTGGWHLDHDHAFEKKDPCGHRGALCSRCNRALGYLRDDYVIVAAAVDYLQDHALKLRREAA